MEYKLLIHDKEIVYKINFSKRKSIAIQLIEPYKIEVKAPTGAPVNEITKIVDSKKKWIYEKSKEMELVKVKINEKKYVDGETHLIFGNEYKLQITIKNDISYSKLTLHNNIICILSNSDSPEYIKILLEKLYRKLSYSEITKLVDKLQPSFTQVPTDVKVKEQKRRWGSCTGKDALLFNWRLSMCPSDVIEYVVLHEMCHMVHKNHSRDYWNLVSKLMPDYEKKELWLKENVHNIIQN